MNVVIVESPSKAKTINKYLGNGFKVLASFGHIRDLPSKDGSVDTDHDFAMNYVVPADSEKNIRDIISALKGAETLYLATDPDREGEAISWHVLDELQRRNKLGKVKVHRVEFHEITKTAVQHAIAHPRTLNMDLINAQQARRALDYLVGFNLSPVLWRKVRPGLSAGRVQSVALRLICEREANIQAFKAEEYWTIDGTFTTPSGKPFVARLTHLGGDKLEKFSITSAAQAEAAVSALKAAAYRVANVEKKEVRRYPSPPFTTSTLQQEASRKLGFGARKTMTLAQRLYEGVDLGGETVGLITYMRTDSFSLSQEALNGARAAIGNLYGAAYVPESPNFYKTKAKNAQEAHEAIRPTLLSRTSDSVAKVLDKDELALYDLIWKRTMACQMAPARLDQTTVSVDDGKANHQFRATGSIITFPGFLRVYREGLDDNATDDLDETMLPAVNPADSLKNGDITPAQHFTEPPPRFSEATLVKALEEKGIGRPSTYASIVSTIVDRGYVKLDKKRFYPEDVGLIVNKFLVEHFPTYVDLDFTAHLEDDLDAISRGEKEWKPVLKDFWTPFKALVDDKTASVKKSDVTSERTGETCPSCKQGELIIRLGRYGRFKGCSRYPECRHIENLKAPGAPDAPAPVAPKDTGITCPACGQNHILEKVSRKGKVFYSCAGYPKCTYALWDQPVAEACPSCSAPFITVKETKKSGTIKRCVKEGCGWQDPPATPEEKERSEKRAAAWAARKEAAAAKKGAKKTKATPKKTTKAKVKTDGDTPKKAAAKPRKKAAPKTA
jgi:DNA topoisomerase-1